MAANDGLGLCDGGEIRERQPNNSQKQNWNTNVQHLFVSPTIAKHPVVRCGFRQGLNYQNNGLGDLKKPTKIKMEYVLEPQLDVPQSENKAESRELSFGEKLVGLNFNPANDDKVSKAKRLCADLADLVMENYNNRETTMLEGRLINHTIGEILNAQMNVVKLLTLKY
jgi:hypothetical protein